MGIAGYYLVDIIRIRIDPNPTRGAIRRRPYQIIQSLLAIANGGLAPRFRGWGPAFVPVQSRISFSRQWQKKPV
jgi:hypothetical protein